MPNLTPKEIQHQQCKDFEDCFCYGNLFLDGLFHLTFKQKTKVNEWLDINDNRTTNKINPSSLSPKGLQKLYSKVYDKDFGCDLLMDEECHYYWFNGKNLYTLPNSQIIDFNKQQRSIIEYEIEAFGNAVNYYYSIKGELHA